MKKAIEVLSEKLQEEKAFYESIRKIANNTKVLSDQLIIISTYEMAISLLEAQQ